MGQILVGHLYTEEFIRPHLIGQDDGDEKQHHDEHDFQGQRARRGIEGRQAEGRIDAGGEQAGKEPDHAEKGTGHDGEGRCAPGLEGGLLHQEKADAHQPDHGQGRHEEQRRVGQIVAVQAGEEDRGHQKDDRHAGQDGPKLAGQPGRPFGQVAIGAYDQPQGAVHHEEADEQHAGQKAIGVEQGKKRALVDSRLIDGNALEDVAEGHAKEQRRQKAAHEDAGVPYPLPGGALYLVAEFEGYPAQDQGEENQHQRRVQG
ncbi:hypothetical protein DESC_780166 [Desulfosarcina cetonica]|nr:hypothetical protein DESC_780166 [Desulfosarcina cetonica]